MHNNIEYNIIIEIKKNKKNKKNMYAIHLPEFSGLTKASLVLIFKIILHNTMFIFSHICCNGAGVMIKHKKYNSFHFIIT